MTQKTRIILAVTAIIVIAGGIVAIDLIRRETSSGAVTADGTPLPAGAIPIYVHGELVAGFTPDDLDDLDDASFVDDEQGKTQEGWLLRDIVQLHVAETDLTPDTALTVSSSSRDKAITLTWAEVAEVENMVMFDLSGRGTLKLVSRGIERLDIRDEWVQDVDKIEIES